MKASALAYTLLISLLAAMLIGSLLMIFNFNSTIIDRAYYDELARDNMRSGINLVLYGKEEKLGQFRGQIGASDLDSFDIRTSTWGLFGVMNASGNHGRYRAKSSYLFGAEPESYFSANLFLFDDSRPLTLAGKTKLNGTLYLPQKGIKRGFVGNEGFQGAQLYTGEKYNSKGIRPKFDYHLLEELKTEIQKIKERNFDGSEIPDEITDNPFDESSQKFSSNSHLILSDKTFRGNIIISAPAIVIQKETVLEDVCVFAREIRIEKGFEGSGQFFATDTLIVEDEVKLKYPSTVAVINSESKGDLRIGKNCELEGIILNDPLVIGGSMKKEGRTLIDEKTEVWGSVVVRNNLDLKGIVHGFVMTENFRLTSPSSVYENYLKDATITSEGLSENFVSGLIYPDMLHFREIKKINLNLE